MNEDKKVFSIEDSAATLFVSLKQIHEMVVDNASKLLRFPGVDNNDPVVMSEQDCWLWGIAVSREDPSKAYAVLGCYSDDVAKYMNATDSKSYDKKVASLLKLFPSHFSGAAGRTCHVGIVDIDVHPSYSVEIKYDLFKEKPTFEMAVKLIEGCNFMEESLKKIFAPD